MRTGNAGRFVWSVVVLVALLLSLPVHAAVITYLGGEVDTQAGWRTAAVDKPNTLDLDGDNVYGTDGYDVIMHHPDTSFQYKESLPSYISSSGVAAGVSPWANATAAFGYAVVDDPAGGTGNAGIFYRYHDTGTYANYLTFTVASDKDFVVGILSSVSNPGGGMAALSGGHLYQTVGGDGNSGQEAMTHHTSAQAADTGKRLAYNFFQVEGAKAGDVFVFDAAPTEAFQASGPWGITYDAIPEPATMGLIASGLGFAAFLKRRRKS